MSKGHNRRGECRERYRRIEALDKEDITVVKWVLNTKAENLAKVGVGSGRKNRLVP